MRIHHTITCCLATTNVVSVRGFASPARHVIRPLQTQNRLKSTPNPSLDPSDNGQFRVGEQVQVEVINFGPLGASVEVVGLGHSVDDLIPQDEPALGKGLVLQKEIHYFRQARDNVDVLRGEVIPAYIEHVQEDGKLNIALRRPGGKAKAEEVSVKIMNYLAKTPILPLGDKSTPEEIGLVFPGVSKGAYKKAVGALYKSGKIKPSHHSITIAGK